MLGDILLKPSTKLYINSSTTGHEGWFLMSGGGALICGGSSCTVADLEFPAGINHKLLFKTNTMINTVCGTSMPAENCTEAGKNETVNTRCVVDGHSSSDLRPTLGRRVGRRQLEAAYQAAVTAVNTRAQLLTIYPRVKHCWVYISGQIRFTNNYTIQIHPMRRLVF